MKMERRDTQDTPLQTRIVIVDDQSTGRKILEKIIQELSPHLQVEALKPYEMRSAEIWNHTAALPQNFQKTCRALTAYLDGKPQTR